MAQVLFSPGASRRKQDTGHTLNSSVVKTAHTEMSGPSYFKVVVRESNPVGPTKVAQKSPMAELAFATACARIQRALQLIDTVRIKENTQDNKQEEPT